MGRKKGGRRKSSRPNSRKKPLAQIVFYEGAFVDRSTYEPVSVRRIARTNGTYHATFPTGKIEDHNAWTQSTATRNAPMNADFYLIDIERKRGGKRITFHYFERSVTHHDRRTEEAEDLLILFHEQRYGNRNNRQSRRA